ncbi:hypothetical protein AC624_02325 [Bacillus sp. FJAT-27238]|nr:hypothetical protein AC624_02325 [Bacillus sp. FJAT-27238]
MNADVNAISKHLFLKLVRVHFCLRLYRRQPRDMVSILVFREIEDFNDSFQKVEDEITQVLTEKEKQTLKELLIRINERL